jgi:hypothetical protein
MSSIDSFENNEIGAETLDSSTGQPSSVKRCHGPKNVKRSARDESVDTSDDDRISERSDSDEKSHGKFWILKLSNSL